MTDDRVFYPNLTTDVDGLLIPTPGGVQLAFQVRSARAPERIPLDFELPTGTDLRLVAGDAGAEIVREGRQLASISAPLAADADGIPLQVSYELQGNRLVVRLPHRDQDVHYPALVDPLVDRWAQGSPGQDDFSLWQYSQNAIFGWWRDNELRMVTWPGAWYGTHHYANFEL